MHFSALYIILHGKLLLCNLLQPATRGCIGFALCVCVCVYVSFCLSGCQKLIISSLHHIVHSPGGEGFWTHSVMSVCLFVRPGPGVCPGLFVHLTDFIQLLITMQHEAV